MPWHALTLADLEFIEFRQALERAYQREIAVGGSRGYTLYGRKDARDGAIGVGVVTSAASASTRSPPQVLRHTAGRFLGLQGKTGPSRHGGGSQGIERC